MAMSTTVCQNSKDSCWLKRIRVPCSKKCLVLLVQLVWRAFFSQDQRWKAGTDVNMEGQRTAEQEKKSLQQ